MITHFTREGRTVYLAWPLSCPFRVCHAGDPTVCQVMKQPKRLLRSGQCPDYENFPVNCPLQVGIIIKQKGCE